MKPKTFSIFLGLLISLATVAMAQVDRVSISSDNLKEDRDIYVALPASYDPEARYPLILLMDASHHFNLVQSAIQTLYQDGYPKMILAGIVHPDRYKDLASSRTEESASSGGAAAFLEFIKHEVLPKLKSKYAISEYEVLVGHSLGGLFTVYASFEEPELFNAYIASTPTVRWNEFELLKTLDTDYFQGIQQRQNPFFLSLGDETGAEREGVLRYRDIMMDELGDYPKFSFRSYPSESHATVPWLAYWDGLKMIFSGFKLADYSGFHLSELVSYYRNIGQEYDYDSRIPQRILLNSGQAKLDQGDYRTAITIFEYYAAHYPSIPLPFRFLGDAYFSLKNMEKAKANYTKALSIYPSEHVKLRLEEIQNTTD